MPYPRGYRRFRRKRAARSIQRSWRGKRRVVKRTSTRKLALINRRMQKKANDRVECKYIYQGWNKLRVPPSRAPIANGTMSTYQVWSTQLLTDILPLRAVGGLPTAATPVSAKILSANQREGKDVYISGIHVKLMFEFAAPASATTVYPPWADCHAIIVRERQNTTHNPAPGPGADDTLPDNTATIKVPTTVSVFNTDPDTATQYQQGNLLWKNMQSGHNYVIAAHKKVRLSSFPAATDAATPVQSLYVNSAKYMDFHYHPKCKVEYNTPLPDAAGTTAATQCPRVYRVIGQKNNVYCIFWSVMPTAPTGLLYTLPVCSGNTVCRFTDS